MDSISVLYFVPLTSVNVLHKLLLLISLLPVANFVVPVVWHWAGGTRWVIECLPLAASVRTYQEVNETSEN